jgi:predicted RNA-binding Zn-ribbon protein involved in translation (DUF1610 family)
VKIKLYKEVIIKYNMDKKNKECDDCGILVLRKQIKRIRGKYYCSKCAVKIRENHRKETIEETGIEIELKELKNQICREKDYARKSYARRVGKEYVPREKGIIEVIKKNEVTYIPKRYQEKKDLIPQESDAPIKIKGSVLRKPKVKSNSYFTLKEQRNLLRVFMSYGNTFEEAKEKIGKIKAQLKSTRESMKSNTEEEFKVSKDKLLSELWKN